MLSYMGGGGCIIPQQEGPVERNQAADPAVSSAVNWGARNIQVIKKTADRAIAQEEA